MCLQASSTVSYAPPSAVRCPARWGRGNTPIIVHARLGFLSLAQGEMEHAIRVLDQGLALWRASGSRNMLPVFVAGLGSASALQGRSAEGRALLEEGRSASIRMGVVHGQANGLAWCSEVCRRVGRGDAERGGCGQGGWHVQSRPAEPVPGVAGTDLLHRTAGYTSPHILQGVGFLGTVLIWKRHPLI